jgi:ribonucleoside-diphosphate reductase beta chain
MFEEAINLEIEFINEALRVDLLGIKKGDMARYIKYCGDKLLQQLGYAKLYNATQPFTFMDAIN